MLPCASRASTEWCARGETHDLLLHAFEDELLHPAAGIDLSRVQISLGIGRHVVRVAEVAGLGPLLAEMPEDAKRLAIQDPDVPVAEIRDVEVLLLRI